MFNKYYFDFFDQIKDMIKKLIPQILQRKILTYTNKRIFSHSKLRCITSKSLKKLNVF